MRKKSIAVLERPVFLVMLLFIYIYNYQSAGFGNTITNGLILLFIGIEFLVVVGYGGKMLCDKPLNSYIFFLLSCMLSVTYSFAPKDSFAKVKTLLILVVFLYAMMEFLRCEKNLCFMLRSISWSAIIAGIYLLLKSDWANGSRMNGVIGDSNQVGAYLAYSLTIILYCWKKKLLSAWVSFPAMALLLVVSILSGSRSSLVITLLSIGFFLLSTIPHDRYKPLKLLLLLFCGIALLFFLVYLVMTNALLYKIIGSRFVSFFEIMRGGDSSIQEYSTIERTWMRELAWAKFTESVQTVCWGNGISYFNAYFLSIGGRYCFCHNNYFELLSGIGVIGTGFYYFPYILTGYYGLLGRRTGYKLEAITVLILLMQIFLMHWFVVFYYQKLEFVFISLLICFGRILKKQHDTEGRVYVGV